MTELIRRFIATLIFGLLLGNKAMAHTYTIPLGEPAGATDYFGVLCSAESGFDTDHLMIEVRNETPGKPLVTVQVRKDNVVMTSTDPVSGDTGYSEPVVLPGGNGQYFVTISKTAAGIINFTVTVHCLDKTGSFHTGTDFIIYQVQ